MSRSLDAACRAIAAGVRWGCRGLPYVPNLTAAALTTILTWAGAQPRTIFLVRGAAIALSLQKRGVFAKDNTIVVHADDAWHHLQPRGTLTARRPKRAPGRTGS